LLLGGLTSVLTLAITLGATEIVLRIRHLPFRSDWVPSENAMAQFDADLGWSYVPERTHEGSFGSEARRVSIRFDALGSRVGEEGAVREPARPTVLFIGCSYTMGHGLPYEETFAGRLAADPTFPFQVVNLGVQGYGTDQALLMLQRHLDRFPVAAVVYTFIEDHVPRNHNDDRRLMIPGGKFLGTKPMFALRGDGSLYLAKRAARYEDLVQSNLVNWVRLFCYRRRPRPGPELTEALIAEMERAATSRGARFLVVLWRQGPPPPGGTVMDWRSREQDGSLVDTGDDPPPDWDRWLIPGDGHPDARAHARVAELIGRRLAAGIPASPAP
jgi:hypothetical protein